MSARRAFWLTRACSGCRSSEQPSAACQPVCAQALCERIAPARFKLRRLRVLRLDLLAVANSVFVFELIHFADE